MEKRIYLQAFLLSAATLVLLIWFSSYFQEARSTEIDDQLQEFRQNINEGRLFSTFSATLGHQLDCPTYEKLVNLTKTRASQLGRDVAQLEQSDGLAQLFVQRYKKEYTIQLLESWLYHTQFQSKCENAPRSILYFYTNRSLNCIDCLAQGRVLDQFESNPNVVVYAVEANLGLDFVELLKQQYQVSDYPSMVLDGNRVIRGFKSLDEISDELDIRFE